MPNQISTSCTTFLPLSTMNGNECIGDSLNVINDNFTNTANNFCSLQTTLNTLTGTLNGRVTALSAFVKSLSAKDSNTVDLTFDANSYILSADIVNSSLGTVKLGQDVTTLGKRLLTSTTLVLSSLDDVQITSLQTNEVLKWNGSKWVNQVDSAGSLSGNLVVGDKIDIYVGGPANNDVNNWQINAGAVDSTELANNAVITTKIYNGAVTTSKLASATGFEAVVTETIRDNAITTAKISALAVTESRIGLNAISETKIVNNAVTNDKLATAPAFTIKGNPTSSTGTVQDIVAADNKVLVRTGGSLQFANVPNSATTGTRNADSNTLVLRDGSGNFSAGVVEASAVAFGFVGNLQGNALSATQAVQSLSASIASIANNAIKLQTARRVELSGTIIGAANFDGTSNITITTEMGTLQDIIFAKSNIIYVNASTSSALWRGSSVAGGNDAIADGSVSKPFKTLTACLQYVYSGVNFQGNDIKIRLCPGMYQGTSISGMPIGTSTIGTTKYNKIFIEGDTGSASYITQFQLSTYNWRHMDLESANIYFDNITFRYDTSLPFVVTAGPGTGTASLYAVIYARANSNITFANCVFEAVPLALTNENPQQTYTRYIHLDNYSYCLFENITINNFLNGTGATTTMGRYFWIGYRSRVIMNGTVTFQNGPRFSAFCEPSQGTYYTQSGSFSWSGAFGTRLGGGGNEAYPGDGYLPNRPNNYCVKQDGPHCSSQLKNITPTNGLRTAYNANTEAASFNQITWY